MTKTAALFRFIAALLIVGPLMMGSFAKEANACACCGSFQVVGVQSWDVLNVRSGPGVGYQITGALAPGEACIVKTGERRGNWVHISYRGAYGWVNRRYLAILQ